MKLNYKQRLFAYFLLIFVVFAAAIIVLEQYDERKQRTELLKNRLDDYADIVHAFITQNHIAIEHPDSTRNLITLLPQDIRISIIDADGTVRFDKHSSDLSLFGNHADRPEIRNARYLGNGFHIRTSASTQEEYLYYAKHYTNYFVRVALPYDMKTVNALAPGNVFIYIVFALFVVVLLLLYYVAGQFGKSVSHLRNLAVLIREGKPIGDKLNFPDDELGEIGNELVTILAQKERGKLALEGEREKMIQHFHYAQEGIAIFDRHHKKTYTNTNFYKLGNILLDLPTFDSEQIISDPTFQPAMEFVNHPQGDDIYHTYTLKRNGRFFAIQTILFEDGSFEIIIKDVSKAEKSRLIKQEITSNIAHELRTPVTSLRGYLETLNAQPLPPEKSRQFIERAFQQSVRLSTLIDDISLISKMEEAPDRFVREEVNIYQLINYVRIDLSDQLSAHHITLNVSVRKDLMLKGNYTLLYAIFRNLIDNSIHHAGDHIQIDINNYVEDSEYVYFSYFDTGKGVDEEHLPRLFERFYRVGEGRTRNDGGSGLGLSIVKNAVLLHKGDIQVRNRFGGGLAFFFTLKK